ncbi:MAG: hypothetical protein L0226_09785 [Acidobacteria bacterium]|nr:hypothetical protein [Acidobacteriota bacterium]
MQLQIADLLTSQRDQTGQTAVVLNYSQRREYFNPLMGLTGEENRRQVMAVIEVSESLPHYHASRPY